MSVRNWCKSNEVASRSVHPSSVAGGKGSVSAISSEPDVRRTVSYVASRNCGDDNQEQTNDLKKKGSG